MEINCGKWAAAAVLTLGGCEAAEEAVVTVAPGEEVASLAELDELLAELSD